jgi:hypothetical protein
MDCFLSRMATVNRLETEAQRRRNFRADPADSHSASCSRGALYSHGAPSSGGGSTTSGISGGISPSKESEGSLKTTAEDRFEEQDLANFLSGKRKRGRGTVGSRADMPGADVKPRRLSPKPC